jgi:hypothetical protein
MDVKKFLDFFSLFHDYDRDSLFSENVSIRGGRETDLERERAEAVKGIE